MGDGLAILSSEAECIEDSRRKIVDVTSNPSQSYLVSFEKRAFDIFFSVAILLFILPILVVIAIAIKASSPGPVFFRQMRGGAHGLPFCIFKFRSMYDRGGAGGNMERAWRADARVTRAGRFLRRHSLDELPQLLNVIKGDMSLVGPRPHTLEHDAFYSAQIPNYKARFAAKPGITGLAQVSRARGETRELHQMERRIGLDIRYCTNASFGGDVRLVLATVKEVLVSQTAF